MCGFERLRGINFGDDDFGARTASAAGQASSAPAVAGDYELRSCQQEVGGANDAVDGRLAGAVAVVEQVLGVGVVDRDDGEAQHAFLGHGAQADDAGGGFFRAADHAFERVLTLGVQQGDQVGAVIHGDLGLVVDGGQDVTVVGVVVLALDGKDRNVVIAHQAGSDVILGGERIRGAEHDIGAAILQADGQVRGFGGDVQASRHADALQGLVLDEFLANDLQDFHGLVGPVDPLLAEIGKVQALDITIQLRRCGGHTSPVIKLMKNR